MTKEKKVKKEPKPVNEAEVKEHIDKVIDQLAIISGARGVIKNHLTYLKEEYGLSTAHTRKAATVIFERKMEDLEQNHEEIRTLIEMCE